MTVPMEGADKPESLLSRCCCSSSDRDLVAGTSLEADMAGEEIKEGDGCAEGGWTVAGVSRVAGEATED